MDIRDRRCLQPSASLRQTICAALHLAYCGSQFARTGHFLVDVVHQYGRDGCRFCGSHLPVLACRVLLGSQTGPAMHRPEVLRTEYGTTHDFDGYHHGGLAILGIPRSADEQQEEDRADPRLLDGTDVSGIIV